MVKDQKRKERVSGWAGVPIPIRCIGCPYDDWGDLEEYGSDLTGRELMDYEASIREAILENQMPEEKERGLMRWYDKTDGVNGKVRSVVFDVESRNGQLWGVARCQVNGTLFPEEKEILADYISGQASDGWG